MTMRDLAAWTSDRCNMSLTVSLPPQAQAPVSAIVSAQRKQGKRKRKFGRKLCLHDAGEARRAVAQALRMWLGSGAQEGQRPEPERLGPGGARRGRGLPQGLGCMLLRVDSRMLRGRPPDSVRNGDASEHQRSAPHNVCSTHSLALRPRLRSWLQPRLFRLPRILCRCAFLHLRPGLWREDFFSKSGACHPPDWRRGGAGRVKQRAQGLRASPKQQDR